MSNNPLTAVAQQICEKRYFQKDKDGKITEDWSDLVNRVVRYVCQHEDEQYKKKVFDLLYKTEFLPNSPCLVNAGTSSKSKGLLACQPGWVRINTTEGLIQLKDLVESTDITKIPTYTGDAKIIKRWKNGVKNVLQIETEKGYRLFVTGDHQVYTIARYKDLTQRSKKYLEKHCRWDSADNLREGDALILDFSEKPFPQKYVYKNNIKVDEDLARILAFAKCDGHLKYHQSGLKKYENKTLVFEIIVDSEESLNLISNSSHIAGNIIDIDNSQCNPYLKRVRAYGEKYSYLFDFGKFDSLDCDIPDEIFRSPQNVVAEFCRAVFDCEGTLSFSLSAKTGKKHGHVAIGMISESFIRDLQKLLNLFGIQSSVCGPILDKRDNRTPMYYLSITNTVHLKKFQKHIGFISSRKNRMLSDYLESVVDENYDKFAFAIKSIKDIGEHEVYDLSTSNETYLSEGIVVHNCFVTKSPEDSWNGMLENIGNYGHIARQGGGCGVDFSNIRPEGDPVFGSTHAKACGPIEHMRMISEVMSSITQSGFRGMACATYDTLVSTESGFIPIGQIVEEDLVGLKIHTQFGEAHITQAWYNGKKEVFEVITEKGNKLKLTGDHKVYVIEKYNGKNHSKLSKKINSIGVWKELKDVDIRRDCLVLNLDEKPFSSEYQYVDGVKLDEELASLVSCAKCNGHFVRYNNCQRLELALDSEESIDHFMNFEQVDFNRLPERSNGITVLCKEGKSVEFMKKFGEFGTYHCDIPLEIFRSPKSVVASFIRAAFDAEGTVDVSEDRCRIITGMTSLEFIEGLQILLGMFGIQSQLRRDVVHVNKDGITKKNMHYLTISNKWHAKKFIEEIGFLSDRKNTAAKKAIDDMNFDGRGNSHSAKIIHRISKIESLGEMDVYDISTTNETFLANNLVVHNCMGCLRVDHPDIINFITCKQHDRALKTLLKEDIFNHYDQLKNTKIHDHLKIVLDKFISNFNISVFATDEFMEKVENNEDFNLIFNNKIYATVKAREIFDKIVLNAWQNGDPGMLFYDTINDGPYKYSGQEITATNPCGEQCLPQYGSCNLGSIDVSKFFNDNRGIVEWTRLREAIEVSVQFLDNVIDVNSFPTKDFAKWAKENRPVGLGIMGWADLLLKMEIAYGSEKSFKFAQRMGRFFQKIAHEKSVALAKERGTPKACRYDELEYRRNVTTLSIAPTGTISLLAGCSSSIEPIFSSVIYRYDNTGQYEIPHPDKDKPFFRCSSDLSWQEHVGMQAAFQTYVDSAISKCITGNSLVVTDNGLQRIEDLSDNREEDTFTPINLKVTNGNSWKKAQDFYYGGRKRTIKLTTENGFVIEGTPNHKIKIFDSVSGSVQFERLDQISIGDYCPILFNTQYFGNVTDLSKVTQSQFKQSKHLKMPKVLNSDLSYLLGVITTKGDYQASNSIVITYCDKEILNELNNMFKDQFGIHGEISSESSEKDNELIYKLSIHSKNLVQWMQNVADIRKGYGNRVIPSIILRSTQENIATFLGGLCFDGYLTHNQYQGTKFGLCLNSESVIRDLQIILANMGINSHIVEKYNKKSHKYFFEIAIYGKDLLKIRDLINIRSFSKFTFRESLKQHPLMNIVTENLNNYNLGSPCFITEMASIAADRSKFSNNLIISEDDCQDFLSPGSSINQENVVLDNLKQYANCVFQEIVSIEESNAEVFDIYVPEGNTFVANGFINHNTINFPNNATVEDVADAYMFAWKNRCKGITVYRDGCKTTQVLNTRVQGVMGSNNALPRPKEVVADIFKTTADGFDWHVIVGKVNDVPYEVFAVNGKHNLPSSGRVIKRKKRHYSLVDDDGNVLIENIGEEEDDIHPRIGLETRRFSMELRHNIHPSIIVSQIDKSHEVVTSFTKAVGRILKNKYISANDLNAIVDVPCLDCAKKGKSVQMISEAGCWRCPECFSSKCG